MSRTGKFRLLQPRHKPDDWVFFFYRNDVRREQIDGLQIVVTNDLKQQVTYMVHLPDMIKPEAAKEGDEVEEGLLLISEERNLIAIPQSKVFSELDKLLESAKKMFERRQDVPADSDNEELS